MTRIVLTRHGHVEGITPERFRGRAEVPLTAFGRQQVAATAQRIAGGWRAAAVYTSPMGRCVDTGAAIAAACGATHAVLGDLNDLDYGDWQWQAYEDIRARSPQLFNLWRTAPQLMRFPGGESLQQLVARVADALRYVLQRHPDETVVLVSHDSANRALLLQLLDQPISAYWCLEQQPCALSEIDVTGTQVRVLRVNETAHLEGLAPAL